ncbi:uncharacterized protein M6B38_338285 [Iris pallida]|uniref:4-coumarate--CoA ligase n=1 Tax=Iris pallida TaxID=29817 RepID=A0AAX6GY27_IRIPA|nr:uncharacterized protein M6B38_338285 [Iris pallida]
MSSSSSSSIDPKSGYCPATKTFHSLRPPFPLPPLSEPHSAASYSLSSLLSITAQQQQLLQQPALIDSSTSASLSFSDYVSRIHSLAHSLRSELGLKKGQVAFILSPTRIDVPILYLSLLSLGVVVSPSNPLSSASEISHQFSLSRPSVAFVVSAYAHKLPPSTPLATVLIDSQRFQSFLLNKPPTTAALPLVLQPDPAAILYSSGTTGRVKGAVLSHRNFVALIAGYKHKNEELDHHPVGLFTVPLFHVFGFFMLLRSLALGQTTVLMGAGPFDFEGMLAAAERYRVTYIPVSPPLVVAMAKSELVGRFDLSSLRSVACGGAPLGKEVSERFTARFPHVQVIQGYGLTESTGAASDSSGPDESRVFGSAGRLSATLEARIVDPDTGEPLGPGQRGELWLRGPTIMKGYVGDDQATVSTLTSDGWLKTGDLCYFDNDGFLFIVDRLKELIKYKAYQVPPAELEHILQSHPEIVDAAVIPYPDEDAGEIPMAFVVRQPGSALSEEQVMAFVAKQVAPYKKVRRVAFVSSIPKSAAGKIMRRELVDQVRSKSKL